MCRIVALTLVVCVCAGVPELRAQSDSPQQVAEHMLTAMRASDWGKAASLMHPDALRQLRALFDPILTLEGQEGDGIRGQMFGFPSRQAAVSASDSSVFASLMTFMSQQAGLADALQASRFQYLGTVGEGTDTVHVVGRIHMSIDSIPISQMEVISLARFGSTWRGMLKGDLVAMANAMRAAIARDP